MTLRKLFKCLQYYGYLSHKKRKDNFCGTKDQQYRSVTTLVYQDASIAGLIDEIGVRIPRFTV